MVWLDVAKLREITDKFLNAIIGSIDKMPFGIRYIAMEMKEILKVGVSELIA